MKKEGPVLRSQRRRRMKINDLYYWEVELSNGTVYRQWGEDGNECSWKNVKTPEFIVRASLIPKVKSQPRHDVMIDLAVGEKFVKRFGRGFIKQTAEGFKLKNYLNCIVTNRYRLWVFPDGQTLITRPDYEVRL